MDENTIRRVKVGPGAKSVCDARYNGPYKRKRTTHRGTDQFSSDVCERFFTLILHHPPSIQVQSKLKKYIHFFIGG